MTRSWSHLPQLRSAIETRTFNVLFLCQSFWICFTTDNSKNTTFSNLCHFSFSLSRPCQIKYQIGGSSTAFMMGRTKIKFHEQLLTNKSYGLVNQRFAFICLLSSQTHRNLSVTDKPAVFEQEWTKTIEITKNRNSSSTASFCKLSLYFQCTVATTRLLDLFYDQQLEKHHLR